MVQVSCRPSLLYHKAVFEALLGFEEAKGGDLARPGSEPAGIYNEREGPLCLCLQQLPISVRTAAASLPSSKTHTVPLGQVQPRTMERKEFWKNSSRLHKCTHCEATTVYLY